MLVFAVGSIITILVIFLTANFFTMRKIRQDEIEKIKTKLIMEFKNNSLPELKQEFSNHLELLVETRLNSLQLQTANLELLLKSKDDGIKIQL